MTAYVLDGILYSDYPDDLERLENLRADRDAWKDLAITLQRRVWTLEADR